MAYIYIIKNDINNKVYIGKTNFSIKKRWIKHLEDSKRQRNEKRPLYNAINKYGEKHFWIEQLEECSIEESSNREIYWINQYNSFKNGYNATLGGDGKSYLDYKKILNLFDNTNLSIAKIAIECNCHPDSVTNIIHQYRDEIDIRNRWIKITKEKNGKAVKCIELNKVFNSLADAAEWLKQEGKTTNIHSMKTHISFVCRGKRQTAGGYHWIFI